MNRDLLRLITTAIIWFSVAGMVIAGGITSGDTVPLAFILGIGATISTGVIWDSAKYDAKIDDSKAKRTNRVTRLVDNLDEDEVLELADLLDARRDDRLRN